MNTMMDEIYDRAYQAARADLNHGISAAASKLGALVSPALSAIYHFEWDAPWAVKSAPKSKA
jgi:hypothetical protein